MNKSDQIREAANVMLAAANGKPIEFRNRSCESAEWQTPSVPVSENDAFFWNWYAYEYRIALIPDSIDWSHVNSRFKYMARDKNGDVFLYSDRPCLSSRIKIQWTGSKGDITNRIQIIFASYKQGNVDWKDSLVERPKKCTTKETPLS